MKTALVWFRRDLRCFDHAALAQALAQVEAGAGQVACVFVYDPAQLAGLPRLDRRLSFIHSSIAELDAGLRELGGWLRVAHGAPETVIPALARELGAEAVFANRDYEPAAIERDQRVARTLRDMGCAMHQPKDQVIFDGDEVLTLSGQPFSVFTPYKRAWLKQLAARPAALAAHEVEARAGRLEPPTGPANLPTLAALGFEQAPMDGGRDGPGFAVPPGMSGAAHLLDAFDERIAAYGQARDFPALPGTSLLSTHLRFGTCSIRHLVRHAQALLDSGAAAGAGVETWRSELIWREFYMMILAHHPQVVTRAFKPAYDAVAWDTGESADALFAAWCDGRTGYPLVDAAMLQLNCTGFMHNRLRMVSASFLVKDLGIDWRRGEAYFALKLNDYELASNNGGWQWAASTGCDAQPWFRIFNPVTQSRKFDPHGRFIRRHLPQLSGLSDQDIHAPWTADPARLAQVGVHIGDNYPAPVVDHDAARRRTLARYEVVRAVKAAGWDENPGE